MTRCFAALAACVASALGLVVCAPKSTPLWTGDFEKGWEKRWSVSERADWGKQNLLPQSDPNGKFPNFLRVAYPAKSASPTLTRESKAPVGGAQFYANLGIKARDSLHLRYYVRFAEGFDFVKGGKLPGLYGGVGATGGKVPDGESGFSTRFMWRAKGAGEVYAYLPTSKEHGTSLGRGKWRFAPGKWHLIEQAVNLNTPDRKDGRIRVWFDEKLVLDEQELVFRTTDKLKVEGILFSTFFGGDDASWATPEATHTDFAAFAVGEEYLGP